MRHAVYGFCCAPPPGMQDQRLHAGWQPWADRAFPLDLKEAHGDRAKADEALQAGQGNRAEVFAQRLPLRREGELMDLQQCFQ